MRCVRRVRSRRPENAGPRVERGCALDGRGKWLLDGAPGGIPGATSLFVLAAWFDQALPQSWGLSNALELRFQ